MTAAVYAGHHVGMAWERGLACGLLAILGLWAAGLLLSFAPQLQSDCFGSGKSPRPDRPPLRFWLSTDGPPCPAQ